MDIRTNSMQLLSCVQSLYQNKIIDATQKDQLVRLIKNCLSNASFKNKNSLVKEFQLILYANEDMLDSLKQMLKDCIKIVCD